MIEKVLKYQGNEKYICILCSGDKNELFIFYALTEKLNIEVNKVSEEQVDYKTNNCRRVVSSYFKNHEIKIPIIATKNSHIFHLIKIDNEKEYEHICSVVESLA